MEYLSIQMHNLGVGILCFFVCTWLTIVGCTLIVYEAIKDLKGKP